MILIHVHVFVHLYKDWMRVKELYVALGELNIWLIVKKKVLETLNY